MSTRDDGGFAFPIFETDRGHRVLPTSRSPGLTLRDYFAAQALAGMVSGSLWNEVDTEDAARIAFEIADEMIRARGQPAMNANTESK